ncbi:MAG: GHKL domain-containing protein [Crocinitomicaceae bacterium]|nr:GHKL domain-containing protein [Crocinitomicaceae bacterium]
MNRKFKQKFLWSAALGFLLWLTGFYLYHFGLKYSITEDDVKKFENSYQEKCAELEDNLQLFLTGIETRDDEFEKFAWAQQYAEQTQTDYFVYTRDTMTLWTSNSIPVSTTRDTTINDGNIILLQNGYYKFEYITAGEKLYVAAMLIKYEYGFENDELVNKFSPNLLKNFKGKLLPAAGPEGYPVKNKYGKIIFRIAPLEDPEKNTLLEVIIFFCYMISFMILIQLLINATQKLLLRKPVLLVIFPIALLLLRVIWIKSGWLGPFEKFELFNPELFASEGVSSLGDLIINVAIFYLLVHFLLKRTRNWFKEGNTRLKLLVFIVPLFTVSFLVAFEINDLIRDLVYDSQIKFDLEYFFDLDLYSFISIGIIGTVFYCYFRLIQYIVIQLRKSEFELNKLAFLWFFICAAYIVIDQIFSDHSLLTSCWPVILSGVLLWFQYQEREYKFVHIISALAFISFYAAYILNGYTSMNEKTDRIALAEIVEADRDEEAEYDYSQAEREMKETDFLVPYFSGEFNQKKLNEDLEYGPFRRLKKKYDLTFYLFKRDRSIVEDFKNYEVKGYDRIIETIRNSGERSDSISNIYYIRDYYDKLSYIGHFLVTSGDSLHGHLFTEMRSKKFPEDIGLPSLLLEEPVKFSDELKHYSIAKYVENKLVNDKGEFSYPLNSEDYFTQSGKFEEMDGYSHYVYECEKGHKTVLSKKITSGFALLTAFSYLLIFFGVLLLIPISYQQFQAGISFKNLKMNVKIHAAMIGLILTSLIAFGIGAGTFVERQYHDNNKELIKEKITSVKTEFQNKLKDEKRLRHELADYLEYLLKKFSGIFLTDINLYTLEGDLLASSQPKIYSKGIVSRKMNPEAYRQLKLLDKSEFIHDEQIGSLTYMSAYMPFYNNKHEMLAYLNVQYISRQGELENQISGFLLAITNIMVFMLALSVILAITLSNRLTRPLKYIQDSLRSVQIGSASKPIEYSGSDEIGELVKEYNKKVEELQINAEQLAKSERESAWREMAKQVAHEIKNPLTPMKLSIQHLKRSINLADDDSKEKLERVTKSLIDQIDALTQIANEFSNFAKMPKASENELDLKEILRNAATVFADSDEYEFSIELESDKPAIIWADKDLLLRVFNNLIKNATQAVKPQEDFEGSGKVEVSLEETADYFVVAIKDNGIGISDSQREKIFVPYFTTKSTGTGLGLAMTKQIIENHGGKIWFESIPGEGTTFYVSLKKHRRD